MKTQNRKIKSTVVIMMLVSVLMCAVTQETSAQNTTCANPTPSLVSRWSAEGNAYDSIGSSNGNLQDNAGFITGKVGQAFKFDGTNHVSIANATELNPLTGITIDTWFKPLDSGSTKAQALVNKGSFPYDWSYYLGIHPGGQLAFQIFTVTNGFNSLYIFEPGIYDGQFHHIAGTYDGVAMKLYLDGALVATQAATGAMQVTHKDVLLGIGSYPGVINPFALYTGLLDEVEIHDKALDAPAIASIYNGATTCVAKPTAEVCTGDTVLLDDNFNSERNGVGIINYNELTNWDVTGGSVDLLGGAFADFFPDHPEYGMYLDTDGSTSDGGRIASRSIFTLSPGAYQLQFDLSGSRRLFAGPTDTLVVSLGSAYEEAFSLQWTEEFKTITRTINISEPTSRRLVFEAMGGDTAGLLLDNIKFTRICGGSGNAGCAISLNVPGTSNPWLAGMPDGSLVSFTDTAPAESPVLVNGLQITPGRQYHFSATGGTSYGVPELSGPDGIAIVGVHVAGPENGIATVVAPFNGLMGVFLDDFQPNLSVAPDGLNFYASPLGVDYASLNPALRQPFFIGDGQTTGGAAQMITAPAGATRLYLGTMDSGGWYNNLGSFQVIVSDVLCNASPSPTPSKPDSPQITGGLPADGGLLGPGTAGVPGSVPTVVTGTGHADCSIQLTVSDALKPNNANNNRTLTTTVALDGSWSIPLTLDDCDPVIVIVQICDSVPSDPVRRHIFVDGTPPIFISSGGPTGGVHYSDGGGTTTVTIDGGGTDPHTYPCAGDCWSVTYEWYRIGGDGSRVLVGNGGAAGTRIDTGGGPGSGLTIDLGPGDYDFEVVVTDGAGNHLIKRCHIVVYPPLTLTSGLPADSGIMGPGDGYTITPSGHVGTRLVGRGSPGCTVEVKITDPRRPASTLNNVTYNTPVDASGNWALNIEMDDCDPVIEIRETCEGVGGAVIRRLVYVDGKPPIANLGDGNVYVSTGGTGQIVLDPGASDPGSLVPSNGLTYQWTLIGDGGNRIPLCTNCPGTLTIEKPVGDYLIEVKITDSAGNVTTKVCHRSVLKRPTTLSCAGTSVNFGGLVTFTASLRDSLTNEALSGKEITYRVGGNLVNNPFEAFLLPANYEILASFAGDDIYQSCTSTGSCPLEVRLTPGKITGGGSLDEGVRNFGFVVQTKSQNNSNLYTGSLDFQDKARGINLHCLSISIIAVSADRLHGIFTGTATVNGTAGYSFTAWVDDLAEPGAGVDKFRIQISSSGGFSYNSGTYATLEGKLDRGGNIQIHKAS